ncbi:hypothetical protein [Variovorax sp. SRS16]|uniref:hypothetical protein n=1 Tax=Variovorax sp. SRS16 TaxID=282217 RepID=UPI0013A54DD8|nr:hypothetical protein [Variovorax sp. SRS16]
MAITRRVTNITEDFLAEDASDSMGGTQGAFPTPSLNEIKADVATSSIPEPGPLHAPQRASNASTALRSSQEEIAEHFSGSLRAWLGHHAWKLICGAAALIVGVIVIAYNGGERLAKIDAKLDVLDRDVKEARTEIRGSTERIVRLEAGSPPKGAAGTGPSPQSSQQTVSRQAGPSASK